METGEFFVTLFAPEEITVTETDSILRTGIWDHLTPELLFDAAHTEVSGVTSIMEALPYIW